MDSREKVEELVKKLLASGLDEKTIIQIINNIIINININGNDIGTNIGTNIPTKNEENEEDTTAPKDNNSGNAESLVANVEESSETAKSDEKSEENEVISDDENKAKAPATVKAGYRIDTKVKEEFDDYCEKNHGRYSQGMVLTGIIIRFLAKEKRKAKKKKKSRI